MKLDTFSISTADGVSRAKISPPIEVEMFDICRFHVVDLQHAAIEILWHRGWASGKRSVLLPLPGSRGSKDSLHFVVR